MSDLTETPDAVEDDVEGTWLADAQIGRIDLVHKGANGLPFLIAKGQGGFLPPEAVQDLLDRNAVPDPAPVTTPRDDVTLTGSPAAITKMIFDAAQRAKARPTEENDMTDDVSKAKADLDITEPLSGAGDASPMPGTPEWEEVDAATASKWIGVLGRAKNAICLLAEREMQEAAVGEVDGAENAMNLGDASSAIDCAISILAPYAVGEQMDADQAQLSAVGKALAGADEPLDVIERLAPVVKAGRVLSGKNEQAIRDAVTALQGVLASLPAPIDESGQPVAKEADMAASPTTLEVEVTPVVKAVELDAASEFPTFTLGTVTKAKGDPVTVVFNADGKLIGVIDPADLMPVSDTAAKSDDSSDDAAPATDDAAPADDAAAAAPAADAADQAAAAAPDATADAAAAPADDDANVQKSTQSDGVAALSALLNEALTPIAEKLASNDQLASVVKGLQERVEQLAKMPDDRKSPLLNGAFGTGDGNEGAGDAHAELRKAVEDAKSDAERRDALQRLAYAEVKARFNPTA
jgi:hypothetical protein